MYRHESILSVRQNESESKVSILLPLKRNNETNWSARGKSLVLETSDRTGEPRNSPRALSRAVSFLSFNPTTRIQVDERRRKAFRVLDFPDCRRTSLVLAGKPRKRIVTLSRHIKYFRLRWWQRTLTRGSERCLLEFLCRVANQRDNIPSAVETLFNILWSFG